VQAEGVERRLMAVLAADVVGYSRLMAADETGTHARLRALRKEFIEPATADHHGRIVKLTGDGALMEFASVVDAVACAVAVQEGVAERQADLPENQRIRFRIGINIGDVIIEEEDIYGDGVNVAARLEPLAEPGGICVSRTVYEYTRGKVGFTFEPMGAHRVKNIPEPVTVYRVVTGSTAPRTPRRARRHAALLAGACVAVAAGLALWLLPWPSAPPSAVMEEAPALPDKPSLAVLPFDNLSDHADDEYFADGLTDDLITDLAKISGLFIIARNSVFAYKDRPVDLREVARELGVRYLLEGSVRRAGDQVRINAQLIDGATGNHLWAERYDREYANIFTLQDEVIARIVEALAVQLTESEQTQVARLPTHSLEAYDYYLRGEELAYRAEPAAAADALALYEKAITLDRDFADAYAGYARVAADVLAYTFADALPAAVARKRAYEAASRALALNPQHSRAYAVLALLQMVDGEHAEAVASAREAVGLSPNSAEAHLNLAIVLTYAGMQEEALAEMETVLRLNPKPPGHVHDYQGLVLYMNRRYTEAVAALTQGEDFPKSDFGLQTLAAAYARLGRMDEAAAATEAYLERYPNDSLAMLRIAYAHHARAEDLAHRLDGLRLAGFPEWPYGFEGQPEHQLKGAAIDALTFGRTWIGERAAADVGPFMQFFDEGGAFVERGPRDQFVGTASRRGDLLCQQTEVVLLGRAFCGPIYRNPTGTPQDENEYTSVSAFGIKRFAVTP
jgi:adenylate cyclase